MAEWKALQPAARKLGLQLESFEVLAFADMENVFAAATNSRVDALMNLGWLGQTYHRAKRIAEFAPKQRLPSMHANPVFVRAGGLLSHNANYEELFRRAAMYVHKILNGTTPADLPIEEPAKFELVVNLQAAKAIGLTIPRSVLLRADRIMD